MEHKQPETPPISTFKANSEEISYNFINSALTGLLAFLMGLQVGQTLNVSCLAGAVMFVTRFLYYWNSEKREYSKKTLFCFV